VARKGVAILLLIQLSALSATLTGGPFAPIEVTDHLMAGLSGLLITIYTEE
jgi:hypothetical protein